MFPTTASVIATVGEVGVSRPIKMAVVEISVPNVSVTPSEVAVAVSGNDVFVPSSTERGISPTLPAEH